eukprot:g13384.t1
MVLETLAALGAEAAASLATVWGYNQNVFNFDARLAQSTLTQRQWVRKEWIWLYREDVKALTQLTTQKMSLYTLFLALQLAFCGSVFGESSTWRENLVEQGAGFGGADTGYATGNISVLYPLTLALTSAILFSVLALYFAIHATVLANSCTTCMGLKSRILRDFPTGVEIDAARKRMYDFEQADVSREQVRLPFTDRFLRAMPEGVRRMGEEYEQNLDEDGARVRVEKDGGGEEKDGGYAAVLADRLRETATNFLAPQEQPFYLAPDAVEHYYINEKLEHDAMQEAVAAETRVARDEGRAGAPVPPRAIKRAEGSARSLKVVDETHAPTGAQIVHDFREVEELQAQTLGARRPSAKRRAQVRPILRDDVMHGPKRHQLHLQRTLATAAESVDRKKSGRGGKKTATSPSFGQRYAPSDCDDGESSVGASTLDEFARDYPSDQSEAGTHIHDVLAEDRNNGINGRGGGPRSPRRGAEQDKDSNPATPLPSHSNGQTARTQTTTTANNTTSGAEGGSSSRSTTAASSPSDLNSVPFVVRASHLDQYRGLQRHWQVYDAYTRVIMLLSSLSTLNALFLWVMHQMVKIHRANILVGICGAVSVVGISVITKLDLSAPRGWHLLLSIALASQLVALVVASWFEVSLFHESILIDLEFGVVGVGGKGGGSTSAYSRNYLRAKRELAAEQFSTKNWLLFAKITSQLFFLFMFFLLTQPPSGARLGQYVRQQVLDKQKSLETSMLLPSRVRSVAFLDVLAWKRTRQILDHAEAEETDREGRGGEASGSGSGTMGDPGQQGEISTDAPNTTDDSDAATEGSSEEMSDTTLLLSPSTGHGLEDDEMGHYSFSQLDSVAGSRSGTMKLGSFGVHREDFEGFPEQHTEGASLDEDAAVGGGGSALKMRGGAAAQLSTADSDVFNCARSLVFSVLEHDENELRYWLRLYAKFASDHAKLAQWQAKVRRLGKMRRKLVELAGPRGGSQVACNLANEMKFPLDIPVKKYIEQTGLDVETGEWYQYYVGIDGKLVYVLDDDEAVDEKMLTDDSVEAGILNFEADLLEGRDKLKNLYLKFRTAARAGATGPRSNRSLPSSPPDSHLYSIKTNASSGGFTSAGPEGVNDEADLHDESQNFNGEREQAEQGPNPISINAKKNAPAVVLDGASTATGGAGAHAGPGGAPLTRRQLMRADEEVVEKEEEVRERERLKLREQEAHMNEQVHFGGEIQDLQSTKTESSLLTGLSQMLLPHRLYNGAGAIVLLGYLLIALSCVVRHFVPWDLRARAVRRPVTWRGGDPGILGVQGLESRIGGKSSSSSCAPGPEGGGTGQNTGTSCANGSIFLQKTLWATPAALLPTRGALPALWRRTGTNGAPEDDADVDVDAHDPNHDSLRLNRTSILIRDDVAARPIISAGATPTRKTAREAFLQVSKRERGEGVDAGVDAGNSQAAARPVQHLEQLSLKHVACRPECGGQVVLATEWQIFSKVEIKASASGDDPAPGSPTYEGVALQSCIVGNFLHFAVAGVALEQGCNSILVLFSSGDVVRCPLASDEAGQSKSEASAPQLVMSPTKSMLEATTTSARSSTRPATTTASGAVFSPNKNLFTTSRSKLRGLFPLAGEMNSYMTGSDSELLLLRPYNSVSSTSPSSEETDTKYNLRPLSRIALPTNAEGRHGTQNHADGYLYGGIRAFAEVPPEASGSAGEDHGVTKKFLVADDRRLYSFFEEERKKGEGQGRRRVLDGARKANILSMCRRAGSSAADEDAAPLLFLDGNTGRLREATWDGLAS